MELHRLVGRARGWIEAQPVGPARRASTLAMYRRYAELGMDGVARWKLPEPVLRRMVEAGTRVVAVERLGVAVERLEGALASRDCGLGEAAEEVRASLDLLATVPPRRPGRRARAKA